MNTIGSRAIRRVATAIVGLLFLSVVIFVLFDATPGRGLDETTLERPRTLDGGPAQPGDLSGEPWRSRYASWLTSALRGDLGQSKTYGRAVRDLAFERLTFTLWIAVPSVGLAWTIALPIGLWAAARSGRLVDRLVMTASAALLAVPEVILAFAILWTAVWMGWWRPGSELLTTGSTWPLSNASAWSAAAAPMLLLTLTTLPHLTRNIRTTAAQVLRQPFVAPLRARGVSEAVIVSLHVLRASLPVLLTLFTSSLTMMLGGALVAEVMFSWPGVGALLYRASLARDEPLVVGLTMVTATCTVLLSLLGELAADFVDPRSELR